MSSRKLNPLEQRLHQAALNDPNMTLTVKDAEIIAPDAASRTPAINFLLATGLLRAMKGTDGRLLFRALGKKEVDVKKDLAAEENLVLSHIQATGNEGIWTKHLKAKTELHQTVIDRCLKSLVQKKFIKSITNVKHPTRKTYMLFHLKPSASVTGGPWYTDNELDTEFIKLLLTACLKFIRDKSFPRVRSEANPIFPISASPPYPTAEQVLNFLSRSRITETELSVEHAEMLLNVLIMDGEVEKIPSLGGAFWDANAQGDEDSDGEKIGSSSKSKSKSKRKRDSSGSERSAKRRRRKSEMGTTDESNTEGQMEDENEEDLFFGSESEDQLGVEDDDTRINRSSSKSSKPSKHKKRSRSRSGKDKSDNEDFSTFGIDPRYLDNIGDFSGTGGNFVYRATRREHRVASKDSTGSGFGSSAFGFGFGWSQAPCGRCPVFNFCNTKGPVNPQECEYYGEWLGGGNATSNGTGDAAVTIKVE